MLTFSLILLQVESCVIHLCHPLYQLAPVCVRIKLIDEQFIRLMGSAEAENISLTKTGFQILAGFAVA